MAQVTNPSRQEDMLVTPLCVDYVVNPTPAMMEIGTNFHKTLTPLVKDREVLHENTLPWRKTAQELQNEPKFVTWK